MERRRYDRVKLGIEGTFYLKENDETLDEFLAVIDNVSENGIKVTINATEYEKACSYISAGKMLQFQAIDETPGSVNDIYIFQGNAEIVRKSTLDGKIVIGCRVEDAEPAFKEYVKDKILTMYFERAL